VNPMAGDNTKPPRLSPPKGFEPVYEALKHDLIETYAIWNALMELFNSSPQEIALLNKHGKFFFYLLQNTYFDHVVLCIGRLLDPPKVRGKNNMCIACLCDLLKGPAYEEIVKDARSRLEHVRTLEEPLRVWRNRRIAHADYKTSLKLEHLPVLYVSNVKQVLEALAQLLDRFSAQFYDSTTAYDGLDGAGREMLELIRMADQHYECERRAVELKYGITLSEPQDDAT
jgi:hypothetical protein